jgi:transcriptional regulator with XRE-family HTH domain
MREEDRQQAAYDYAERIRARLPECLMAVREEAGLSRYALADTCGISRNYLGQIERGLAIPGIVVVAQVSHGSGLSLVRFCERLEV